ncbi:MAG: hypothetical protein IJ439_07670 [Tyzzerella sp.]|nr:hypothetical protein [Tyzzerella sp.]
MEKLKYFIQNLTKKQILIGISVLAAVVVSIAGGIIYYDYQMEMQRALEEQEESALEQEIVIDTSEEEPEVVEVIQQMRNISFSGTSIEKDLKIKIVDESAQLVSGVAFKITVFPEGAEDKGKDYTDEDMDGIIHIENMDAGKYTVKLHEMENFTIAENPILVEVKAKIEYVKVNVADEIKKESQVNTKVEDTAKNNVPVESEIVNTVPLYESKMIETVVEKQNVSTSNFTPASVSASQNEVAIGTTKILIPQSVTLYSCGSDASKNYTVNLSAIETSELSAQSLTWSTQWSIDNAAIATLSNSTDTAVTVVALQNGTASITATISDVAGNEVKRLQMSVNVGNFTDDKTQLQDLKGNALFLDSEAKQIATLKDYSTRETFYGAPKYTGWQTLDGKVYYFDANYQPVTGEQVIGGLKYTFGEDGSLIETRETRGIDVSKHQGKIDWNAVANAGIDFAIIRVGYRGLVYGTMVEDECFKTNISEATKAGIKVGVYFYSQAITEAEAIEEASAAITLVRGYHLDYPIFIDTEEGKNGRANSLSRSERTKIVKAFCETVKNAGYKPGVYANKYWLRDNLYASQLEDYFIWVAQYNTECTYDGKYDMWQYTSTGSLPGITGNVDMNICYKGI